MTHPLDPLLDATFERTVVVPVSELWKGWTDPDVLVRWFTPAPWETIACDIDLRPGGAFRTVMRSPDGDENHNVGCYLEIVENRRLVWTTALGPGFRPMTIGDVGFAMTATIEFDETEEGTRYTATVRHADEEGCRQHLEMGFEDGWGVALDQLVSLIKNEA